MREKPRNALLNSTKLRSRARGRERQKKKKKTKTLAFVGSLE
jgi:hypothetical protein